MNDNSIEAVRSRVDIVDLIGEQVRLQKTGRSFKGLCPFHGEKTPSFHVNAERQTWHCFGSCSTGGDVFSYVMKRDSIEFGDALRALAERAGVQLSSRAADAETKAAYERLYAANEAAIAYFQQALRGSSAGAEARTYVEKRGFDTETQSSFELGFAPEGWDYLHTYLRGKGFADEELFEVGLLIQNEQGGIYDRFRRRLMFPIRDDRGRAVGFGGRALDDAKPKYLNTPQTPVFDKGSLLYALHGARDAIRAAGEAVIVEGYVDAMTAHQFGHRNVVATLGTALTERHIQLLRRLTRRVTLAMDADAAGIEAALRGEEVARTSTDGERAEAVVAWDGLVRAQARAPVDVRVFTVPSGKDPDEAIREDPAGWTEWVQAALPPFEFRLQREGARTDMSNPRARLELADRMLPLLLQIGDQALQAAYVARLAEMALVPETRLAARLRALTPRKDQGTTLRERQKVSQQPSGSEPAMTTPAVEDRVESLVLSLLLRFPELREAGMALEANLFQQTICRELFGLWLEAPNLTEETSPELLKPLHRSLMERDVHAWRGGLAELALLDAVRKLQLRTLEEQKRLGVAALHDLQTSVDGATAARTVKALQTLGVGAVAEATPEAVLTLIESLREDEYLTRELHALEGEKRTGKLPRWAATERAGSVGGD